jgi:hypothetical protein
LLGQRTSWSKGKVQAVPELHAEVVEGSRGQRLFEVAATVEIAPGWEAGHTRP